MLFQRVVSAGFAQAVGVGVLMLTLTMPVVAAGNAAAGKAKAQTCFGCHGPEGRPAAGAPFPALAGQDADYIAQQLRNFKTGARASDIMKGQATSLSDKDIQDLGAYFASLPPMTGAAQSAEVVKLGEKIFRGGVIKTGVSACMSCHGPSGHGIPPRFPRVSGQTAAYTQQQLLAFKSGQRKSDGDIMTRIAFRMSEGEIKAVSQYMAGLH